MDARYSWELLVSIFHPQSPMHDGAVIIQQQPDYGGRLLPALDPEH